MLLRRPLSLLLAAFVLVGPAAAAVAQAPPTPTTKAPSGPSDDLSQPPEAGLPSDPTERDKELQNRIAGADVRQGDLLAEIDASDKRRADLDLVVSDLDRQVRDLNAQLASVGRELDKTTGAYITAERDVQDAQATLGGKRERVQRRAAEVYKQGPGGFANFILGARDLGEAGDRLTYVRQVVHADRTELDALASAEVEYKGRSETLEGIKTQQFEARSRIASVQEKIAANFARQRSTRDQVAAEVGHKRAVLAKVQSDRAAWQALVARQQLDSSSIGELLAQYQNGQKVPAGVVAGMFILPVRGEVTSQFGWRVHPIWGTSLFHAGLDLAIDEGTPIKAGADGVVVSAGWLGGYGNATLIDNGRRIATLYGHQSRLGVSPGQQVRQGDVIGYVGSTGYSTGPHLHFEVRVDGQPTDPVPWLRTG